MKMAIKELKLKLFNSLLLIIFISIGLSVLLSVSYFKDKSFKEKTVLTPKVKKPFVDNVKKVSLKKDTISFKQHLFLYMDSIHLKYPKVVLAQAILESNHFRSNVFLKYNNLFGMKIPSKRPSLRIHAKSYTTTYSSYKSWKESVIDYALYQSTFIFNIKSEEEYLNYISKNYTNAKHNKAYKNKLQKIMANI